MRGTAEDRENIEEPKSETTIEKSGSERTEEEEALGKDANAIET